MLKIVDESQQDPEISVNIFVESLPHLPHIESYADLILLERVLVLIQFYPFTLYFIICFCFSLRLLFLVWPIIMFLENYELQITTYNGDFYVVFKKKYSSFALFSRNAATNYSPYQTFPLNATPVSNYDKFFFDRLRNWALNFDFDSGKFSF